MSVLLGQIHYLAQCIALDFWALSQYSDSLDVKTAGYLQNIKMVNEEKAD